MTKGFQVAIDGPASAGKSTVAKLVAQKFGYIYCDTGAMYRAVTLAALQQKIDLNDQVKVAAIAENLPLRFETGDPQQVWLGDQNVTQLIRTNEVAQNVSTVAAIPAVRQAMVKMQREIASQNNIVMDGRDIGTTVLPQAPVKIFMVASAHERARRRYLDNQARGIATQSIEELQKAIELRDQKDSTRKVSPLVQAADAIRLDTTALTIDEVVNEIIKKVKDN
ncbi:(d)CMP kinase [Limosilactobacillus gastricus]|uniref:Cytidylate kinase n=1 Tax=Limosilactobacillus gastricus DSM 16045 TaxID=1423749 RepID=A0A0R1VBS4_9LACO|nr:(d)CMP kinase [Limosilactobacillus gastricus]KRM02693.1 Cytidylate kinase (CK) [Limosilactobacillus gastricus DSM 16045]QGF40445.1 (d)CMP kinase [Limosilactobacillus gastricus]